MKKSKFIPLAVIALLLFVGCKEDEPVLEKPVNPDVRQTVWNMTMDEVIFCEGREPDERLDNSLIYKNIRMEKIPVADIEYKFYNIDLVNTDGSEKLLSSVTYTFAEVRKLDERQLHNTYIDIAAEYTKKYGKHTRDERITERTDNGSAEEATLYSLVDLVHDTTFSFGGTALYITEWQNEAQTANIRLKMTYDDKGPVMEVLYEYIEPNNDI